MSGHYRGEYKFSEAELVSLMEVDISLSMLNIYLGDLIEQAEEARVKELYLLTQEILMITTLSKTVSSAMETRYGQTSLTEH